MLLSQHHLDLLEKFSQSSDVILADRAAKLQSYVQEMARNAALLMKAPDVKTLKMYDAAVNALLKQQVNAYPDYRNIPTLVNAFKMLTDTRALITTMMRTYNIS